MPSNRPNVLFICTDQQSAGALGCAGRDRLETPAMDSIAETGVRFTNAYCTDPVCNPSRSSLFSGRMPHEIGVAEPNRERGESGEIDPAYRDEELGNLFQAAGYDTAYAGKWHVGDGLAMAEPEVHGFDERIAHFDDWRIPDACAEYLERDHDDPFFLVASFDNPHNICEWSRNEKLPWGDVDPPAVEECPPVPANHAKPPYEPSTIDGKRRREDDTRGRTDYDYWRQYRYAYHRLIEQVDDGVDRILTALSDAGLADDTIVVFTSDHGDMQGAHGLNQKHVLYEESVGVPLLVDGVADRGTTDDHLVSNGLDLLPTLCDYAGIDPPDDLLGRSLRPLAEGEDVDDWRDQLVAQAAYPGGRMVRTEDYKYVVYEQGADREQLFDVHDDPGELVDLSNDSAHADVLADHRERLLEWCLDTRDPFDTHYAHGYARETPIPGVPGYEYAEVEAMMAERGIDLSE